MKGKSLEDKGFFSMLPNEFSSIHVLHKGAGQLMNTQPLCALSSHEVGTTSSTGSDFAGCTVPVYDSGTQACLPAALPCS